MLSGCVFLKRQDRDWFTPTTQFSMVSQVDITSLSLRAASSPLPHVWPVKIFALSSSPPRSIHQIRLSSASMMLWVQSPPSSSSIIRLHLSSFSLRVPRSTHGSCWAGMDISSSWVVWRSFIWAELNTWRDCKRREGFYLLRRELCQTVSHRSKRRILCCLLRWTRLSPRQKTRRRFLWSFQSAIYHKLLGAMSIL